MEIPLYYNEKDIELIGTVSNIELIRLVKTSPGDYLNSELYSFEVVINFDKLLPSSALLSKFDNSWFTNNRKSLSKVVIGLDTLKYFKDYLSGRLKVKFLNIHTDVKMFNILLVLASKMSKEDNTSLPFKLSYSSLSVKLNNTIYIIQNPNSKTSSYFSHTVDSDMIRLFSRSVNFKYQFRFYVVKAIASIYQDSTFNIMDTGRIIYKGKEYSDHYDIINSTEFIEDYFLKLDWD